jgi:hypothetical protein
LKTSENFNQLFFDNRRLHHARKDQKQIALIECDQLSAVSSYIIFERATGLKLTLTFRVRIGGLRQLKFLGAAILFSQGDLYRIWD